MNIEELRRLDQEATPKPAAYSVRKDGSLILSFGDPMNGPHEQFDFYGSETICAILVSAYNSLPELLAKAEAHDALVAENKRLRHMLSKVPNALTSSFMAGEEGCEGGSAKRQERHLEPVEELRAALAQEAGR